MITEKAYSQAAATLHCEIAIIKTVYDVEAGSQGYLPDKRVKILFEGHRLWKILAKMGIPESKLWEAYKLYPTIIYKNWDRKNYIGGAAEWDRMAKAYLVCDYVGVPRAIAFKAASYGSFQIMGENHEACGYSDAQAMLAAYNNGGEDEQLTSFINFVKNKQLDDELRNKQWASFAKGYNGTGYRENHYDEKLATAYKKYSK